MDYTGASSSSTEKHYLFVSDFLCIYQKTKTFTKVQKITPRSWSALLRVWTGISTHCFSLSSSAFMAALGRLEAWRQPGGGSLQTALRQRIGHSPTSQF